MVKYVSTNTKGILKKKKKKKKFSKVFNDASAMFLCCSFSDFLSTIICCGYLFELHR